MNKKRLVTILSLCIIHIILSTNIVLAEGNCNKSVDTSKWVFDHSESVQADEVENSETPGVSKKICCELGANQTKRYYCDYFSPTEEEKDSNGKEDGSKEIANIPCDLSDGNWKFLKSYSSKTNVSTTTKTTKVCCKGFGSSYHGQSFQCNSYTGTKNEEKKEDLNKDHSSLFEPGDEIDANCGILSDIIPYIKQIYGFLKIILPIALIIFGTIDFSTPIISNDKEALNKATVKFIKRCIVVAAIFLVPMLLKYILGVYSDITGKDASLCGLIGMIIKNWR